MEFLINLNLNWMGKLIKVLIKETGGEFTCGTLDDKKLVKSIKSKIDKVGEIRFFLRIK